MTVRTLSTLYQLARVAAAAALLSLPASAQDQSAVTDKDVIFARKALKDAVCDRMADIEQMIGQRRIDLDHVRDEGGTIAAALLAFPHLFPPSSNRWKPDADTEDPETSTLASPEIWSDFPDFYRRAQAAASAAFELSHAGNEEDVKTRARVLRIACDTCHALYLQEP